MMTDKRMGRGGATIRQRTGRALIGAAVVAAACAAIVLLSGGVRLDAGMVHASARDPLRPLAVAALLLAAARFVLGRSAFVHALLVIAGARERWSARVAALAALCVLVVGIAWNTRASGGSDSSCYLLQADAFAAGRVTLPDPLPALPPRASSAVFAPAGFVPAPNSPFAAVPICGPGLALMMTPALLIHRNAPFLIVPACAALMVWCTFLLGRRLDDDVTGAAAAVLLACSPILLYQAVQPMSDVPAAALWLAALVALAGGAHILAGFCASAAVMMRPNVALLVLPLLLLLPVGRSRAAPTTDWRGWLRFGLAAVPALSVLAALNAVRYGSPLASGYGSTDVLFSLGHIRPNLARYPRWLLETHTPFMAFAVFAPWWMRRDDGRARLAAAAGIAVLLTMATYLAYTVFDDWWYIRFLLPAIPVLLVLAVSVSLRAVARAHRAVVAVVLCAAIGGWCLAVARTRQVFDLQRLESRFVIAGRYAARALPPNAVVLAVQQSGSVRYHGRRPTLAWDAIAPEELDQTIAWLRANGREPFIVLEDAEEPRFRARFGSRGAGALDWPPSAEISAAVRVRVYDPAARAGFLGGTRVHTEYVR
jgi:hypothetical protein